MDDLSYEDFVKEETETMQQRLAAGSIVELEYALESFRQFSKVRTLSAITPATVERYFTRRLRDVRSATANKNLRTLKASLARAVQRGYLESNPASGVKQVREPEKEVRVLSQEEVKKLLDAAPSLRWRALIALAVTTGMRLGEMLALTWRDLDLDAGIVSVRNSERHLTKSRRNRVLTLLPEVSTLIRKLLRADGLVFRTKDGAPWRNNLQTEFRRIVTKAEIPKCTLHDLRRTFVSQLAMAGVNEAVVQKLAGHSSINTTVKYYTNIMPDALRDAQARLPFRDAVRGVSYSNRGPEESTEIETPQVVTPTVSAI